jgi:V/A-type H+-transporting ATPase subunit I
MFYPARMKKIKIVALDRYQDTLVEKLHELGAVEIEAVGPDKKSEEPQEKKGARFLGLLRRTEAVLSGLSAYEKVEKKSLIKLLFEKAPPFVYDQKLMDDAAAAQYLSKLEYRLGHLQDALSRLEHELEKESATKSMIKKFAGFDIDFEKLRDTRHAFVTAGVVPNENLDDLLEELKPKHISVFTKSDETYTTIILIGLIDEKYPIIGSLLRHEFERFFIPEVKGTPAELLDRYDKRLSELEDEKEKTEVMLEEFAQENLNNLLALREFLEIKRERVEIQRRFGRSKRTFTLKGYIPAKFIENAIGEINNTTKGHAVIRIEEASEEEKEIPIMLDNPKPIGAFQVLTKTYAMPRYDEVDPTFLMALWFPFFFGIMLTDAAYGILLLLLSWFIITRFESVGMRDIGKILALSSIWTITLGLAFGSVFGDLLQSFFKISFGIFDVLTRADVALLLAIIIGLLHLNLGLVLGIKRKLKIGDLKGLVFEHLWILLFEGAVALAVLSGGVSIWSLILFVVVVFILMKKPGGIGPLEINSFFGSNLSYARLLALALATAGIAMAVNVIGGLLMGSLIGGVFGALILFGGHLFNFVINAFGAFVHSMRLHYVEFFSMFYEGGGREFSPFKEKRRYTKKGGE